MIKRDREDCGDVYVYTVYRLLEERVGEEVDNTLLRLMTNIEDTLVVMFSGRIVYPDVCTGSAFEYNTLRNWRHK